MAKRWKSAVENFAKTHLSAKPDAYFTAMEILSAYVVRERKHKGVLSPNRVAKVLNIMVKQGVLDSKKKRGKYLYKLGSTSS
jgi:uncharacterized protein (DUF2384 family)